MSECSPLRYAACRAWLCTVLAGLAAIVAVDAHAQKSHFTLYDQDYGLNVGEIGALAQDDTGFLWIGAHRGLVRFDGHNFVAWAPEQLDQLVYQLIYGPDDQLLVRDASGHGWRRTRTGLQHLRGPNGDDISDLTSFDFDSAGRLWAIVHEELWQRDTAMEWHRIAGAIADGETPKRIYAIGSEVVVLTDSAAWRVGSDAKGRELVRARDLWFATGGASGPVWLATHFGSGLWRVDASGAHVVERPTARVLDMHVRAGTLWLALDRQLLGFESDGYVRRIGIADGLPSGGPMLVDREDSLWVGTFVGLLQFPQPDTWQWGESEGLPSQHAYAIVEHDGVVFASTWGGLAHLDMKARGNFVADLASLGGVLCTDRQNGLWTSDGKHLLKWHNPNFETAMEWPQPTVIEACVRDTSGTLWLATSSGLFAMNASATLPHAVVIDGVEGIDQIWLDDAGGLHAAMENRICRLLVLSADSAEAQDCRVLPTQARANAIAQVDSRHVWIAANDGVFEFDGSSAAQRMQGNHRIEGGMISGLVPAVGGDWWMSGPGVLLRVHPCSTCAEDWEIREAPGRWQGLPGNSTIAVAETAANDLWIAGNRGIWRVPKSARAAASGAPRIVPVRVSIDGTPQATDATIEFKPEARRLELEFAALSYRDRSLLRFRSRIGSGEWSAPTRSSVLQFAAPEPGAYTAEMAASLDGVRWSTAPARVAFDVLPPWYRTWWARALFVLAIVALAAWLYRLRVAALLRVERERTRIAMDLHDELGSGLGSIGMLAGVAARSDVDHGEQRRLLGEIANLSGLLGSGLRSLVWSLRSGRAGIAELGVQLADHARRLFPGDEPKLAVKLPVDPPSGTLSPELRRHMLLFALEALHNVGRHAHARRVDLVLDHGDGNSVRLSIEDDGAGFDPAQHSEGTGLESMRRRAAALRADLRIDSAPGSGTRVVLICPVQRPTA